MKLCGGVGRLGILVLGLLLASGSAKTASAAQGDCAQPVTTGSLPTASDCLFILRAAVGSAICDPACICAPKGSLPTTATDSLVCLKKAVGQVVTLDCPCQATTTTSSTVSSSTSTTTLPVGTATITIVNADGPGEGFNDTSPRTPVGGNNGTTLGQQRLNVFEYVADLWEQVISSGVEIKVEANFDTLDCNSLGAVLGSAGAATFIRNFVHAPVNDTWYPVALANKIAGFDLNPDNDVIAQFNSAIGTTCPFPNVWYYGLDGNPPGGQIDLASVVLHEMGHGLGFATIVDLATGQKGLGTGFDDVFMLKLEDHSTAKIYPSMSNAERVTASKDSGDLHWKGAAVVAASSRLSAGRHSPSGHVRMYAPNPQEPGSSVSHWDTILSPNEIMEPSYTGANHDVGLMRELFQDLGWGTVP